MPDPQWLLNARANGLVIAEGPRPVLPLTDGAGSADARTPAGLSEEEFQAEVIRLANGHGWDHYHTRDSRRSVRGFPDLVLVRERVVFAELKAADGKVSRDQRRWLGLLAKAGAEVYEWRPADWPGIAEALA